MTSRYVKRPRGTCLKTFIEEVARRPYLYDKRDNHKDVEYQLQKLMAWTDIGAIFNMTREEAERKWKVQRDRFNKERKKIKDLREMENGHYASNWVLYDSLDRMLTDDTRAFQSHSDSSNVPSVDVDDMLVIEYEPNATANGDDGLTSQEEEEEEEEDKGVSVHDFNVKRLPKIESCCLTGQDMRMNNHEVELPTTTNSMTDRTPSVTVDHMTSSTGTGTMIEAFQSTAATSSTTFSQNERANDRIDHFCAYLKYRLQNLDKRDRYESMKAIEAILADKEGQDKYYD